MRYILLPLLLFAALTRAESPPKLAPLSLTLRSKVESFKGSGEFDDVTIRKDFVASKTAVILCDIWDKHWCESATKRCDVLAKKTEKVVAALRKKGVTIIHAPSDTMAFYKDSPQRKAILALPEIKEGIAKNGMVPMPDNSVEGLQTFVKSEIARWGKVVRDAGIAGSQ